MMRLTESNRPGSHREIMPDEYRHQGPAVTA